MAADLQTALRGPDAYGLAHRAMQALERCKVWPTPVNFELWLIYVNDPEGALAIEIDRLIELGEAMTETIVDDLARRFLPKNRLDDQIRDAGDQLSRELDSVSRAIGAAQKSTEAYDRTLAGASKTLSSEQETPALKRIVDNLTAATQRIRHENSTLEKQLSASTDEIEQLRQHLEQVRHEAMTDGLTNLANRKAFDEALAKACANADRSAAPVSVAIIDIDHFKRFNDTWGHQTGDQVLRYVATVIGRVGESGARVAARYGGEEFALLFPGEGADAVCALLEAVREEIGSRMLKRRSTNEDLGAVTISTGVAERLGAEPPTPLVGRADAALYTSKRTGRNRVTNAQAQAAVAA